MHPNPHIPKPVASSMLRSLVHSWNYFEMQGAESLGEKESQYFKEKEKKY